MRQVHGRFPAREAVDRKVMQRRCGNSRAAGNPSAYLAGTRRHVAGGRGRGFSRRDATLTLPAMDGPRVDSSMDASDEALMLAYAGGDVAAFEQLYARHRGRLYRFLLRQLRDPALADELFQDVWQRVIAARAGWTPEAPFGTWLYRIAHNRLADHWRALQHRPPAPADGDERTARIPDHDTPERTLSEFEQRRRLQLALDELPAEQREVLLLRLEQDLTLEEIGAITGVGRETVKSRLRYAMDKLRARLPE
jgi:RNA polymerase sigma-70 factor (ECF subfamily)